MSFEIERKFLVRDDRWKRLATQQTPIRQCYLSSDGKASIRVRIKGESLATLTVKSRPVDLRRLELEYPIPVIEAEALMTLRRGAIVEKMRYRIPAGDNVWEVDVFSGENTGLVIAEIELRDENQKFDVPDWVGAEVTGQRRYYNSSLVQRPYSSWQAQDAGTQAGQLA